MIVALLACRSLHPAGTIADPTLDELSGLVPATRFEGFWAIEDSGNPAALIALDPQGRTLGRVDLGVPNRDWEDVARAGDDLYVADIGDNLGVRKQIVVWRVAEPQPSDRAAVPTALTLTWPDEPRDAEALVVSAREQALYVFSKSPAGDTRVGRAPITPGTHALVEVARLAIGDGPFEGDRRVTGAASDGATLILRTYEHAWAWTIGDRTIAEVLSGPPRAVPISDERRGEAIAVRGDRVWTVSEGVGPTLWTATLP